MEAEEKLKLLSQINQYLNVIERADKERAESVVLLKDILPMKEGDKVEIRHRDNEEEILRYAYVYKIQVALRGADRKARIEFDLVKCKKDGTRSNITDTLKYGEFVSNIP